MARNIDRKRLSLGNFNITFGEEQNPMLLFFNEIIYPALISGIVRPSYEDKYFIDGVNLTEYENDQFILTGLLIRQTVLEVKSRYEKGTGIISLDQKYASDPYSIFVVFLKNHRVVLVENQKGSPDIRSLNSTVDYILRKYIRAENKLREKQDRLPFARVNIIGLPSYTGILEKLDDVSKINKLIMSLYPLNGDIPVANIYRGLSEELSELNGTSCSVTHNNPADHKKVAELISQTEGTVKPRLEVTYRDGGHGTLKHDSFTEKVDIPINETKTIDDKMKDIVDYASNRKEIRKCSEENEIIYNSWRAKN